MNEWFICHKIYINIKHYRARPMVHDVGIIEKNDYYYCILNYNTIPVNNIHRI